MNAKVKILKHSKRILGIDPGTLFLGYACVDTDGQSCIVRELGILRLSRFDDHYERLSLIFKKVNGLCQSYKPDQVAVESPFFGKNVQSMLKLGRAQGVAIAAAMQSEVPVTEYTPTKIKIAITGNGKASKEQVAATLQQILQFDLSKHSADATDALAVAVCQAFQRSIGPTETTRFSGWSQFLEKNPGRKG